MPNHDTGRAPLPGETLHSGTLPSDGTVTNAAGRTVRAGGSVEAALAVFTPGTMLAGRYRVVARLGGGGMGEVYRADDVKLGHAVALKFVRGSLSDELLQKLYGEVRVGRQVAHPSVCRVYDVVEVDGQTFLAMEYVDGEDLSSLLARIGRLPADKALEIARDVLSGLAAMHERGIVHRDLKPANVMLDSRGRARITDLGLAMAVERPGPDRSAGTPAYMSPEQIAGGDLTARSDLYAVGLILFEMLTGQRFYDVRTVDELMDRHNVGKTQRLGLLGPLVEPAVQRLVAECLDEDPARRPPSARSALARLPGGSDPLEAAVAAGETPSPEMVAAAADTGEVSLAAAWACVLIVAAGTFFTALLLDHTGLLRRDALPRHPDRLADDARDLLAVLGYPDPAHRAFLYEADRHAIGQRTREDTTPDRWRGLAVAPFRFTYRQSPELMLPWNRDARITADDPPLTSPGMAEVVTDAAGRLVSFTAVPARREAGGPWPEPDFTPLLAAARLDAGALVPVTPEFSSPVDSDRKAAWHAVVPGRPDELLRVEAAAFHGRPVWFSVMDRDEAAPARGPGSSPTPMGQVGLVVVALAVPLGGLVLARRNVRLGRGDKRGAGRVALFVFGAYAIARLFRADHVLVFAEELWILIRVLAYPAFWGAVVWMLYMALEPSVRRRWPRVLVSWKRLLSGHVADPLVGRDVLFGVATGSAIVLVIVAGMTVPMFYGGAPHPPDVFVHGFTLARMGESFFRVFVNLFSAVLFAQLFLFMLVLLRMLLRNRVVAAVAWMALIAAPVAGSDPVHQAVFGLAHGALLLLVLTRSGVLALTVALYTMFSLGEVPLTLDMGAWYASRTWPVLVVLAALTAGSFRAALAGRPAFGALLAED